MSEVRNYELDNGITVKQFVSDPVNTRSCFTANYGSVRCGDLEVQIGNSGWVLPYNDQKAFLTFLGVPATDLDMAKYARKRERRK